MNRSIIYQTYKGFKSYKETKGKLLKQQVFLSQYISDSYDLIDKMLIFHGIGTGKTCTSITIAETIMKLHKQMKILVILPARLKTNFIDELISETCILNKYINKKEYQDFINPKVSSADKEKIRQKFNKRISANYDIISYEKLRKKLLDSTDYKKTIKEITKNRVIIIDEVHNLITSNIKPNVFEKILNDKVINKKLPAINAILLRLMTTLAHNTCKMFLLTATPVFDNYGQFMQLVLNLRPDTNPNKTDLDYLINQIKGKVSFYKLNDRSDFPSTIEDNIKVQLSSKQTEAIKNLDNENRSDNSSNDDYDNNDDMPEGTTFCVNERQLSISLLNKTYKNKIFKNLKEYAPKLEILFKLIDENRGKHVIFSNFIQYCLELIAEYLLSKGWSNYTKTGSIKNKTFVLWDASLNDKEKQEVKAVLNSKNNMNGEIIRVILGSPSIKEGISFKHIQHLHQIDPVWNSSAKEQIEGRCIRYKSHEDIPLNDKYLKRQVIIHNYIATFGKYAQADNDYTCDEKIYGDIMVKKRRIIRELEKLLRKVSIDYFIWNDKDLSPQAHSKSSVISVKSAEDELKGINLKIPGMKGEKKTNSCLKPRRPINGSCSHNAKYPFIRPNTKGVLCCYAKDVKENKEETKKTKNTCIPVSRRPIDGKCKDPKYLYIKENPNGDLCCYMRK